ncbi:hypothetical protein [Elizabethkingia anophelis]|uniref:hypothetical protein n=1 Tax=Elizabethkingia anophelis TaxID=1117645 RepID=UPI0038919CDE
MKKFAKIHDSYEFGQILVTKQFNPEDEEYKITVWFEHEGKALLQVAICVKETEEAETIFAKMDLRESENLINRIFPK